MAFLFFCIFSNQSAKAGSNQIDIYCLSNQDGTGECYDETNPLPYQCIAIPGEVIRCKSPTGERLNCVLFQPAFFSCTPTKISPNQNKISSSEDNSNASMQPSLNLTNRTYKEDEVKKEKKSKVVQKIGEPIW